MRIGSIFFGIVTLSLLCAPGVYAQNQRIEFVPVAQEALVNSYVRCFYKDSKGYMWLGAADGLIRYDGVNTYRYEHNPADQTSICHNHINVIIEGPDKSLFVGTAGGLCVYNREKDSFINVDSLLEDNYSLNNEFITSLSFDPKGRLWIGTLGGGINIYNPETHTVSYLMESADGSNSPWSYLNSLLSVKNYMWCGAKGGLRLFNTTNLTPVSTAFCQEELSDRQITQLIEDKTGQVWLSTLKGEIFKISSGEDSFSIKKVYSLSSSRGAEWDDILSLCLDTQDNLWIGGERSGLNSLNIKTNEVTRFQTENGKAPKLPTNAVRKIYVDNSGLTWIGTFNKGAYLIDRNAKLFENYNYGTFDEIDLKNHLVTAFAEDENGNVWIGYDRKGLRKLDARTNTLQNCKVINDQLPNKYVTALIIDRKGDLWIGTNGKGVNKVNKNSYSVKNYKLESGGFGDNRTYTLYEDKTGVIWAGTGGSGLFYFDENKERFVSLYENDQPVHISKTAYINHLLEDSSGLLWVGSMYGLFSLERTGPQTFEYRRYLQNGSEGSISSNRIQSLYEDEDGNLWIGTTDNGLNILERGASKFKSLKKSDGLNSNIVKAIVADNAGNLWISGNMGLSKFDPDSKKFTQYTSYDGLSSNNFMPNSCLKSASGKLFFGSNNGFNVFYPDSIRNNAIKQLVVHLTDLKINNQSVPIGIPGSPLQKHIGLTSKIKLSYPQRFFRIDFVTPDYDQSFRPSYSYRLKGFDEDWNYIGSGRSANYTNIHPGNYVFEVRASDHDGVWGSPTQLDIKILPALWKTPWAIALYILIVSAALILLFQIRMERLNMKNQLKWERLARQKEHELNESKTQFFTNVSHEFSTPLSLISIPLENIMAIKSLPLTVKERLSTIQLNVDKMMRLVNELMDFNKLESSGLKLSLQYGDLVKFVKGTAVVFQDIAEKRNLDFRIIEKVTTLEGWYDQDKLEKAIVNILSNAFKFTADNGAISVSINSRRQMNTRCLELTIIDNGIGISAGELPFIFDKFYQAPSSGEIVNSGTGIGLSLTKGLVELHKGSIKAESAPARGTKFEILIPVDRHVYAEDEIRHTAEEISGQSEIIPFGSDNWSKHETKPKVLVVEDNSELRKYICLELQQEFDVIEASNGDKGMQLALEKNPDLIISDILMPGKSGIELCKALKSNLNVSHIPVILLTAKTTIEDQIEGVSVGADVYVTKPFSIRYLVAHIRNIITSRQKLYAFYSQNVYIMPSKLASNEIDKEFLQKTVDFIMENIQDPQLSVDAIAEFFNLSRMQTYRKIKALTGKTVVEFIRTIRIKDALQLMETRKYTLSEVAYQSGFNSASYFTKCFKDHFGKAPSEYMEKVKTNRTAP